MTGGVSVAPAAITTEHLLPMRVQEVLGELVGVAREGLLALSVVRCVHTRTSGEVLRPGRRPRGKLVSAISREC